MYELDPKHTDPKRLRKERAKAKELRKTPWWQKKIQEGLCHYCQKKFQPNELTMDHVVPLARGGESSKNNLVPACKACNSSKKLQTPVDELLNQIASERQEGESGE